MALSLGWKANDIRESIWHKDPALRQPLADGVLAAWREDGDASHLEPYITNGTPTIIEWRALNADEKPIVQAPMTDAENNLEGATRAWLRCFRMAVRFKDTEEKAKTPDGLEHRLVVKERGVWMLSLGFVDSIIDNYPGLMEFYGNLVFMASFLSDAEKKALSPLSTATPSSAVASTADTTAPSPVAEAVTGVQ